MNGRGLRGGALRLIAMAAVALGIALFAGLSTAKVVSTLSDDSSPVVVVTDSGSGVASALPPLGQDAPLEATWG